MRTVAALLLEVLCVLYSSRRTLGVLVGRDISPPSGSSTYFLAGANLTFNCSIFNNETLNQSVSQWSIGDIGGSSVVDITFAQGIEFEYDGNPLVGGTIIKTYRNILILRNFNRDSQVLQCAFGSENIFAEYFLFLYRPVSLMTYGNLTVLNGAVNVSVNMETAGSGTFPFPTFSWLFRGSSALNTSNVVFGYPAVTFRSVDSTHSGSYQLSAMNFLLEEPTQLLGSSTGSFTLDVLFGPSLRRGASQMAVEVGAPLSLLCGDQLMSNPEATVTWQDPRGGVVMDSVRYRLINDVSGVRLNFTHTNITDNGQWICNVTVTGNNVTVPPSNEFVSELQVGHVQHTIDLFVVDAPGRPTSLAVEKVGGTWALLDWVWPIYAGLQGVSFYTVTARDSNGTSPSVVMSTVDNRTHINISPLLPVVTYSFSVQAVSMGLGLEVKGQPSESDDATTLATVPAPLCAGVVPVAGGLLVSFLFIHTGGLPLTSISISYMRLGETAASPGPSVGVADTEATITNLVAGYSYVITVTAANSNGSTTATCSSETTDTGHPQPPSLPVVMELPGNTVSVKVRSMYPGSSSVYFEVTPLLIVDGVETVGMSVRREVTNYRREEEVELLVRGLVAGSMYRFRVQIGNSYGSSEVTSTAITVRGDVSTTTSSTGSPVVAGSNTGAIAGGVVAAIIAVAIVVAVIIVVIVTLLARNRRGLYQQTRTDTDKESSTSPAPPDDKGSVDIGTFISEPAPAPAQPQKSKEITYVDLEYLNPPDPVSNGSKVQEPNPIKSVIPTVEYASIESFKRTPANEDTPTTEQVTDSPSTKV